jgi:hypothetical protein
MGSERGSWIFGDVGVSGCVGVGTDEEVADSDPDHPDDIDDADNGVGHESKLDDRELVHRPPSGDVGREMELLISIVSESSCFFERSESGSGSGRFAILDDATPY